MKPEYALGQEVMITGTFTSLPDDTPVDPDTVTLYILSPSGTSSVITTDNGLGRESTGIYTYDLTLTEPGNWWRAFVATGTAQCAEVDQKMSVATSRVRSVG